MIAYVATEDIKADAQSFSPSRNDVEPRVSDYWKDKKNKAVEPIWGSTPNIGEGGLYSYIKYGRKNDKAERHRISPKGLLWTKAKPVQRTVVMQKIHHEKS